MSSSDKHYYFHKINSKRDATQELFEQITCKFLQDFPLIDPDDDLEVFLVGDPITEEHVKSHTTINLTVKVIGEDEELDLLAGKKLERVRSLIRLPARHLDRRKRKPKDRKRHSAAADKSGWTQLLSMRAENVL